MEFPKMLSGDGIVRLEGELNIQDAGRLKETFRKAFREGQVLSLDLGR